MSIDLQNPVSFNVPVVTEQPVQGDALWATDIRIQAVALGDMTQISGSIEAVPYKKNPDGSPGTFAPLTAKRMVRTANVLGAAKYCPSLLGTYAAIETTAAEMNVEQDARNATIVSLQQPVADVQAAVNAAQTALKAAQDTYNLVPRGEDATAQQQAVNDAQTALNTAYQDQAKANANLQAAQTAALDIANPRYGE